MKAKIIMINVVTAIQLLHIIYIPFLTLDRTMYGHVLVITFPILLFTCWKSLKQTRYFKLIIMYFCVLLASILFLQSSSISIFPRFASPLLILASIEEKERKYFKWIFYVLIVFFIANAFLAIIERITYTHYIEYDMENSMFADQVALGELNDNAFRSFALFGHPLWNANIMAFMSFMFYYCSDLKRNVRFYLLLLGIISLFCFNARGAIIISSILLIPTFKDYIKHSKYKIFTLLLVGFCILWSVLNFHRIGGRFIDSGVVDDSSIVRLYTINEFINMPFENLLFGGYEYEYGENGYLEIIMTYGLIIGGLKIVAELFFGYKFISNNNKKIRWIIFLSVILIGSTNNNLYGGRVFPFYLLCLAYIENYSNRRIVSNHRSYILDIRTNHSFFHRRT